MKISLTSPMLVNNVYPCIEMKNSCRVLLLHQGTVLLLHQGTVLLLHQSTVLLLHQGTVLLLHQGTVLLLHQVQYYSYIKVQYCSYIKVQYYSYIKVHYYSYIKVRFHSCMKVSSIPTSRYGITPPPTTIIKCDITSHPIIFFTETLCRRQIIQNSELGFIPVYGSCTKTVTCKPGYEWEIEELSYETTCTTSGSWSKVNHCYSE